MDSQPASASFRLFTRRLRSCCIALALTLWFGIVLLLLVRWLMGIEMRPLPGSVLLLSGAAIAALGLLIRSFWTVRPTGITLPHLLRWALPLTASMLLGLLLCRGVRDLAAVVEFWVIVGGVELFTVVCLVWIRYARWSEAQDQASGNRTLHEQAWAVAQRWRPPERERAAPPEAVPSRPADRATEPTIEPTIVAPTIESSVAETEPSGLVIDVPPVAVAEEEEAQIIQQMTRAKTADGGETIAGRVRVDFASGERLTAAHLSFAPPLRNVPEVHVEQAKGPPANVTVGSVYAHGTRVDVRLAEPASDSTSVWFELYVLAPPSGTANR